jgi:hypothetical protein
VLDSKIRASSSQIERARTNTEPSCTRAKLCYGNEIKDRCLNQGVEPTGKKIGTLACRGNSNQKGLSRLELTGVAWGSQHASPAESTRTDQANSQQRNRAENTRSDRTKGGANSPELAVAAASAQEQNGERTQTEMEETPRQRLKRIEADAGRSNLGHEKRNRRRTRPAHWTESTNEEHFRSEPETKS